MVIDWATMSEVVGGALITGRLHPAAVIIPQDLTPPYDKLVLAAQKHTLKLGSPEQCISLIGATAYERALVAVSTYKNVKVDFIKMLQSTVNRSKLLAVLEKEKARVERGETDGLGEIMMAYAALQENTAEFERLDKIEPETEPFEHVGWGPLDTTIGGAPKWGVSIIAGTTGTGKTHLMRSLAMGYAAQNKHVGLFSLEMSKGEIAQRFIVADIKPAIKKNIYVSEKILRPGEVAATVAQMNESLDVVFVDFADLMLRGEVTEATKSNLYLTMFEVAKQLKKPIWILDQFNRAYDGAMPRISYIKFASSAEQLAKLILMPYNPAAVVAVRQDDNMLPIYKDKAYVVVGKSRHGYGLDEKGIERGPGAILVDFNGLRGFGTKLHGWYSVQGVS